MHIYRYPIGYLMDVSGRELNSGMPLGGIGAGAIEFFPDLTIGNVTIMNNWLNPLKLLEVST
jgi:Predicted bile acid beta-glucosidase